MHDSALAVRRPGECTFFTPSCEVSVDKVDFTPEMIRVRSAPDLMNHSEACQLYSACALAALQACMSL